MASKTQRPRACSTYDARRRLAQSKKCVEVAELLLGEDGAEAKTVATGNAVLAGPELTIVPRLAHPRTLLRTTGELSLAKLRGTVGLNERRRAVVS
jgi:hypothetical protein